MPVHAPDDVCERDRRSLMEDGTYVLTGVESVPELVSTISIPDGILLLIIASHLRSDDFQFKRFSGSYC